MTMEAPEPDGRVTRSRGRLAANLPVKVTLIDHEGSVLGYADAILVDLNDEGVQLSSMKVHGDVFPLRAHDLIIVPEGARFAGIWIKARPIRLAFTDEDVRIGARILIASARFADLPLLLPPA